MPKGRIAPWVGLLAAGILVLGVAYSTSGESLPDPPEHHTPSGFRNLEGIRAHGNASWTVTFPFFARRVGASLFRRRPGAPPQVPVDTELLVRATRDDVPTVTWIGHSTLLVQMGGVAFLTDPTWSTTASPVPVGPKRFVPPAMAIEDLPDIDFLVVSHNHYDHMDVATLRRFAAAGVPILVPLANHQTLERAGIDGVIEMDWWDRKRIGRVVVHCVPAQHWSRRGLFDVDRALWAGWVVISDDRRFYFAGDTGLFPGFQTIREQLGPFDLVALPIGAYEPEAMMSGSHLNPEEAIEAAQTLRAHRSLAIHFGTFDLSDEPLDDPPRRFLAASRRANRTDGHDWVFAIGETRLW